MVDQARLIVAIWRAGSLTVAAEKLGLSVATVSRKLSDLERELGIVLFERSTRSLRASTAGGELAARLERGVEEIDQAMRLVREDEAQAAGTVRVSLPPSLAGLFSPMIASFHRSHPKVTLVFHATERRLDHAEEGVDILLRVGRLVEIDLVAQPLISYPHVLCAAPEIAATILEPTELEAFACAIWGPPEVSANLQLVSGNDICNVSLAKSLITNDYSLVAELLETGEYVGELPWLIAHPLLATGKLVRVLPAWELPKVTLTVLYGARLLPRAVRAFVQHLRTSFAKLETEMSLETQLSKTREP